MIMNERNRIVEQPILQCRTLSCHFGKNMALDNVDLEISRGKIVGLQAECGYP